MRKPMAEFAGSSDKPPVTRDGWVDNNGVRLHYIESQPRTSVELVPIVFIPGALGTAELYYREIESLAPRRCVAISLRGRGKSAAPREGYSLEDHVSDIEAVVQSAELRSFCLMAYSMGVPYAIDYAARNPQHIRGLVLGDYKARLPAIGPEWIEQSLAFPGAKPIAVTGLQRESKE